MEGLSQRTLLRIDEALHACGKFEALAEFRKWADGLGAQSPAPTRDEVAELLGIANGCDSGRCEIEVAQVDALIAAGWLRVSGTDEETT